MQAVEFENLNEGIFDTVLVHFDFYTLDVPAGGYRIFSKLLDHADRVTILTLCAGSEVLVERNQQRFRQAIGKLFTALLCNPRMLGRRIQLVRWLLKRGRIYNNPSAVAAIYQKWAEFIRSRVATHYWLNADQTNRSAARPCELAQAGLFSDTRDAAHGPPRAGAAVPTASQAA